MPTRVGQALRAYCTDPNTATGRCCPGAVLRFTSVNPVWAALAGWLLLHQVLDVTEWLGIALIVVSNFLVSARGFDLSVRSARCSANNVT